MRNKTATDALCLWASAIHHAAGRAIGHPKPSDARKDRAGKAEPARFEQGQSGNPDKVVLNAMEAVERTLASPKMPRWFRAYLLFKYPVRGKYEPMRREAPGHPTQFFPPEAFVMGGHMRPVLGDKPTKFVVRDAIKLILSTERTFTNRLRRRLAEE
jgi:hypothetical protein